MSDKTIRITGVGMTRVKPDFIVIHLNVETLKPTYEIAYALAAEKLDEISGAIEKAGFSKEDLKTQSFDISTHYEYERDRNGNQRKEFVGYKVVHDTVIRFDFDNQRLGALIAHISATKANPEISITFTVKNSAGVQDEILRNAAINARRKAEILTEASGARLGELQSINYSWDEVRVFSETRMQPMALMSANMASMDFEPDEIEAKDSATFTWTIL